MVNFLGHSLDERLEMVSTTYKNGDLGMGLSLFYPDSSTFKVWNNQVKLGYMIAIQNYLIFLIHPMFAVLNCGALDDLLG